ncbi:hypothetical protein PFISCL1PPCAC_4497, partial [Pristionchus fissidentatus]
VMTAGLLIGVSDATDACYNKIPQTSVNLTLGNEGWNNLATGFVNGVSIGLSDKLLNDIGQLFFDASNVGDVAGELLGSQWSYIVFACIGVAIAVLTLIGAIGTCVRACTCRRSSKGISSMYLNITGLILAFIPFGFVIAGIVLYSLSVDSFMNGVLVAPDQLSAVVTNVDDFTSGAIGQISCSVDIGFGSINTDISKLPKEMINRIENQAPMNDLLHTYNYTGISQTLTESKPQVDAILANLNAVNPANLNSQAAKDQVDAAKKAYQQLSLAVTQLPVPVNQVGASVTTLKNSVEKAVNDNAKAVVDTATGAINNMITQVKQITKGITDTIVSITAQISSVLKQIQKFEDNLNKDGDVTGWISAGFKALIIAPCVIALIAALGAFVAGCFFMTKKRSLPSKGCCSAS